MPADKLKNLLNPRGNGELATVVERAHDMVNLAGCLADALPADVKNALRAVNLRKDGELVVIADSPAWAARLRFETETLMAAARAAGREVSKVSVRVSHDV